MSGDTVAEQTVDAIRNAIRDGQVAPGQRLIVGDLMRDLGVSAAPVREAISRLTGEGLIEVFPHRGAVVRALSAAEIREVFAIREVIEGLVARLAAANVGASPEAQQRVMESLSQMSVALETSQVEFINHNHQFHELIYELSGSRRAREMAAQLTLPIYRLRYHHLMDPGYSRHSAHEHSVIGEALLAGDEARAEEAMRVHIRNSGKAMVEAIEKRSVNTVKR